MTTTTILSAAFLGVAACLVMMTIAFLRLRRRYRYARRELIRVATERDQARMDRDGRPSPSSVRMAA